MGPSVPEFDPDAEPEMIPLQYEKGVSLNLII
jgi:hypothetical protein